MNAIIGVDCTKFSAWFTFQCPECHEYLKGKSRGILWHPTHDGLFFKGKPIQCSQVGKSFKKPIQTIKLESA